MKKMLFPVDFSQATQNAFAHALHFAKRMQAQLYILHTFEVPVMDSALFPENYMNLYTSMEMSHFEDFKEVIQALRQVAEREGMAQDQWVHVMRTGSVVASIAELCQELQIDAVVMGTQGADSWMDRWWGTTTWETVQSLNVPLLCIPSDAPYKPVKTIGFTTRFQRRDVEGLLKVLDLAQQWNIQVKAILIDTPQMLIHEDTWEFWTRHFSDRPVQFYKMSAKDVFEGLQQFVLTEEIDLLAMTTHKHDLWHELFGKSQAKQWALYGKIPALIYH